MAAPLMKRTQQLNWRKLLHDVIHKLPVTVHDIKRKFADDNFKNERNVKQTKKQTK